MVTRKFYLMKILTTVNGHFQKSDETEWVFYRSDVNTDLDVHELSPNERINYLIQRLNEFQKIIKENKPEAVIVGDNPDAITTFAFALAAFNEGIEKILYRENEKIEREDINQAFINLTKVIVNGSKNSELFDLLPTELQENVKITPQIEYVSIHKETDLSHNNPHVALVIGTRPEAVKVIPLVKTFKKFAENKESLFSKVTFISTGQQKDMMETVFAAEKMHPDIDLKIMKANQDLHYLVTESMKKLSEKMVELSPDLLICQGDPAGPFASALVGMLHRIPTCHFESGLRVAKQTQEGKWENCQSAESPFPEEMYRRMIGQMVDLNCASTNANVVNLKREDIPKENIALTGITNIDLVRKNANDKQSISEKNAWLAEKKITLQPSQFPIFITCHRRENIAKGALPKLCDTLKEIINANKNVVIIWPVHPNPKIQAIVREAFKDPFYQDNIHLTDTIGPNILAALCQENIKLIISDSGGMQEEALVYGIPIVVYREETERPESIQVGAAVLCDPQDQIKLRYTVSQLINDSDYYNQLCYKETLNPYEGPGNKPACELIVSACENKIEELIQKNEHKRSDNENEMKTASD